MWLAVSSWAGPCLFQADSLTLPWESALCGFVIKLVGHHLQLIAVEVGPRVFQPLRAPSARQGADRLLAVDSAALDCVSFSCTQSRKVILPPFSLTPDHCFKAVPLLKGLLSSGGGFAFWLEAVWHQFGAPLGAYRLIWVPCCKPALSSSFLQFLSMQNRVA